MEERGFTISSVVSKRLFLATLGSTTSSSGGKILPNVFLSSETTRCVGPQLVLNPKGSVKISIVQKALLYKGIVGNVCGKGVINIVFPP